MSRLSPVYAKVLDKLKHQSKQIQDIQEKLGILIALQESPESDGMQYLYY
jgi:hypothetical protein